MLIHRFFKASKMTCWFFLRQLRKFVVIVPVKEVNDFLLAETIEVCRVLLHKTVVHKWQIENPRQDPSIGGRDPTDYVLT
jgi:hypothetical protein